MARPRFYQENRVAPIIRSASTNSIEEICFICNNYHHISLIANALRLSGATPVKVAAEHNAILEAVFRQALGATDDAISAIVKVKNASTGVTQAVHHVVWNPHTLEIIHQHLK